MGTKATESQSSKRALIALQTLRAKLDAIERARTEPIAIVGVGCRFPGGVSDVESFWKLLREQRDGIVEIPAERWDNEALYDPDPAAPGKLSTRWGGFLDQVDAFDAAFFGISPREAMHMDPQQRLLLEVTWDALGLAGQPIAELAGTRTGVFLGATSHSDEYWYQFSELSKINTYSGTGTSHSVLAGRLSYLLDIQGPSLTLDTACSSSLVALHYACQSLRSGDCSMALAGGVNLILSPEFTVATSKMGLMAADGRCKTFDSRANGYVRGEGCGMVVLKRLSDAVKSKDAILALIRGTAVNQDGRTNGLSAPNGISQQTVLRRALDDARVEPSQIGYIESHGTGTALGDPIEVEALAEVFGQPREDGRPCVLGAVKSNIGHLEGAAGVAGLIKAALVLQREEIPANLHFEKLNPHISLDGTRLEIATEQRPWAAADDERRCAGVSSFGWSGTNSHVILEEAPAVEPAPPAASSSPTILPLSARSDEALRALAQSWRDFLGPDGRGESLALRDLLYSASVRRDHYEHRLAVVGRDHAELAAGLEAHLEGRKLPGLSTGRTVEGERQLVFVYSGQGSQWVGMGCELLEHEPRVAEVLERCDAEFRKHASWSLLEELRAPEGESRLGDTEIVQPAIFALQLALTELWRSRGLEPAAVLGHSVGEIAAAHVAGALSFEDAVLVAFHRGRLMQQATGLGKMAAVDLDAAAARELLDGYEGRLAIAAVNSPTSTVLAGEAAALEEVLASLERQGVRARMLRVNYAFHSPQMERIRQDLLTALAAVAPRDTELPLFSPVTGSKMAGRELDASFWYRNVRQTVRFADAVEALVEAGHDSFLEVGPHPVLAVPIGDCLRHLDCEGAVFTSLRREKAERSTLLESFGALYARGFPVAWPALCDSEARWVHLPAYPWQRQRFWLDDGVKKPTFRRRERGAHPLLGEHFEIAGSSGLEVFEMSFDAETVPFLNDHQVQGLAVVPAAAYAEMALAAAGQAFEGGTQQLERVSFENPLLLPEEQPQNVQVVLASEMAGTASFQILSESSDETEGNKLWTLHAKGSIQLGQRELSRMQPSPIEEIRERCQEKVSGAEHYELMASWGLDYGPAFQGIEKLRRRDGEAIAFLSLDDSLMGEVDEYRVHPALLDLSFQVLAAALPGESTREGKVYLPVGLAALTVHREPESGCWSHAEVTSPETSEEGILTGDVYLLDGDGEVLVEAKGLRLASLERGVEADAAEPNWLWEVAWDAAPRSAPETASDAGDALPPELSGTWILLADRGGVGEELRARLEEAGADCITVRHADAYQRLGENEYQLLPEDPRHFRRLLEDVMTADRPACRGVVHLWSLDTTPPSEATAATLQADQDLGSIAACHLVQALAASSWREQPRLWLVTAGSQAVRKGESVAIGQAPLWGLGRVIAHEHGDLGCQRIDLAPGATASAAQALWRELTANDESEDEIALREDERFVARLRRRSAAIEASSTAPRETLPVRAGRDAFRLEVTQPGVFDRLTLSATRRRTPGPGEVEILVEASALNFSDIMKAMGTYPGLPDGPVPVGIECSGKISAVGEGVDRFAEGDEVIALGFFTFGSFVTVNAGLVAHKPAHLGFEEAATLPVAFMTAYYALHHLGRMRRGERVLIHSASGGVGMAAVQLAQLAGAEIFATAGNPTKRDLLRSLGIEHVMDSRSLRFADEVMEKTGGRGVDLILNSLVGEAITKGLEILAPRGRFLELGKRDVYENSRLGMLPFQNNLSFFAIDLDRLARHQPEFLGELFDELMVSFAEELPEEERLAPLPSEVFPIGEVRQAFRHMAQAKHIGKVVITVGDQEVMAAPSSEKSGMVRPDATYLVTGGLGGLGLEVADLLVERGARHLVLASRRGRATGTTAEAVAALENRGAEVTIVQLDVARTEEVEALLVALDRASPPLRGVIHAAGLVDDGMLEGLDRERFQRVMAPKIQGAWNLHAATARQSLDFFVLFSSAATLLGSPGQGNYVAANAFLDALAHYREARHLPALSIDWGPWSEVGMAAAEAARGERLSRRGLGSLSPREGVEALGQWLLRRDAPQLAVMPFNVRQWRQFYPAATRSSLLRQLIADEGRAPRAGQGPTGLRKMLLEQPSGELRRTLLVGHLQEQLAQVMGCEPAEIDPKTPLGSMGLESLQATEFRNGLEATLGLTLPSTLIWRFPTVDAIAEHVASHMGVPLHDEAEAEASILTPEESEALDLQELSDNELEGMLADELASLDEWIQ